MFNNNTDCSDIWKIIKLEENTLDGDDDNNYDDDDDDDDDINFKLEGEHLALRGNVEYLTTLRTLATLEAQHIRAHKYLEELHLLKDKFLKEPNEFLKLLQNGESFLSAPDFYIPEVPEIKNLQLDKLIKDEEDSNSTEKETNDEKKDIVKSGTYNQPWSCEEQRYLEQLLIDYPPEAVEMRRFAKIAKALGNRTPVQVCSRVQKYFQKLRDAQMPIPGKIPKSRRYKNSKLKNSFRPTTFFPSFIVPVHMTQEENIKEELIQMERIKTENVEDEELVSIPCSSNNSSNTNTCNIKFSEMGRKNFINLLNIVRDEKESSYTNPFAQKCANCYMAPILYKKLKCMNCNIFINFCADCLTQKLVENRFKHIEHNLVSD